MFVLIRGRSVELCENMILGYGGGGVMFACCVPNTQGSVLTYWSAFREIQNALQKILQALQNFLRCL